MPRQLPLIKTGLLRPVVQALESRGLDPEIILDSVGLSEGLVKDDQSSTHVMALHQFFENCAKVTGEPNFGALISEEISIEAEPIWKEAIAAGETPADVFAYYVSHSHRWYSSATPFLEVRQGTAIFGEVRTADPVISPSQNDAYMASNAIFVLKRLIGESFNPGMVVVISCDTGVFPKPFSRHQMLRGNDLGFRIQFPSEWLHLKREFRITAPCVEQEAGSDISGIGFLGSFRLLLAQEVGNGQLSAKTAATLASMHPTALARKLAQRNTSISNEIQMAKQRYAAEKLSHTSMSIEEISSCVGYTDPANFARAFRRITGCSPRDFRKQTQHGIGGGSAEHAPMRSNA